MVEEDSSQERHEVCEQPKAQQECLVQTLWVLVCDVGYAHECHLLYASTPEEAEQQAQAWIEQQGERILRRLNLYPSPGGFTIARTYVPGKRCLPGLH
jgi:hypothetical protein